MIGHSCSLQTTIKVIPIDPSSRWLPFSCPTGILRNRAVTRYTKSLNAVAYLRSFFSVSATNGFASSQVLVPYIPDIDNHSYARLIKNNFSPRA